jgi:leucyl/phenylalanyl-tRNA--protein transferase
MIRWLDRDTDPTYFPDPETALTEPPGLLAAGGDLSMERLLAAYSRGIFPWYEQGQPILWWCPDPRAVLFPDELRISRSLRRSVRRGRFLASIDQDFNTVVESCARRDRAEGTWITRDMSRAYSDLHEHGYAHSIEIWRDGDIVGGLYGVAIGKIFFGESMFSAVSDASKVALIHLVDRLRGDGFGMIDCQIPTPHLTSLGSRNICREEFLTAVKKLTSDSQLPARWKSDPCEVVLPIST